jgi:hypothetical protein
VLLSTVFALDDESVGTLLGQKLLESSWVLRLKVDEFGRKEEATWTVDSWVRESWVEGRAQA